MPNKVDAMSIRAEIGAEVDDLVNGKFEEGSLHGRTLSIVHSIINLEGEEATDEECLWMIHDVINHWSEQADEGKI
jgi:hypothetical protein